MTKLVALYRKPEETTQFDEHFEHVHLPLVRQYPGLRRLELTRVSGSPIGEADYHIMAEMYFDDKDAMDFALASRQGKAVARDLMGFAADLAIIFHGEAT